MAGYHLGSARVTWQSPDDSWQVSAIGNNVFDKYYFTTVFDLTGLGGGANYGMIGTPSEYQIQVQKKFK